MLEKLKQGLHSIDICFLGGDDGIDPVLRRHRLKY